MNRARGVQKGFHRMMIIGQKRLPITFNAGEKEQSDSDATGEKGIAYSASRGKKMQRELPHQ